MLSIIISSYKEDFFQSISKNIAKTIGNVEYEIVQIWNPNTMSICQAYNIGAEKAKYDKLLFIHEDIKFLEKNWGEILLAKYFSLPNLGVIGVAGSMKKYLYPTGFMTGNKTDSFMYVFHSKKLDEIKYENNNNLIPQKIKVIDGVFMGMHKNVWEDIKFNEKIKGFHFYDMDFSLRASYKYQNYLVPDCPIAHYSRGGFNNKWIEQSFKFHKKKYYNFDEVICKEDLNILRRTWYKRLSEENISIINKVRFILKMGVGLGSRRALINFLFS